jgi:hypothetical protein
MSQIGVQATAGGQTPPRRRQFAVLVLKGSERIVSAVPRVDVEHDHAGISVGRDRHSGIRPPAPPFRDRGQ